MFCLHRRDDIARVERPSLTEFDMCIHASLQAVSVRRGDIKRLNASPETGATVEHGESDSFLAGVRRVYR